MQARFKSAWTLAMLFCLACGLEILEPSLDDGTGELDSWEATEALTITYIEPTEGPSSGNTQVNVIGSGYGSDVLVQLDDVPCTELQVTSSESLLCLTPAHEPGTVSLVVSRESDGAEKSAVFTYTDDEADTDTDSDADTDSDTDMDSDADSDSDTDVDISYCHVQWPCTMLASVGGSADDVFGWVYSSGVTDAIGQGPGITAQLGLGPDGSDPSTSGDWTWTDATYNMDKPGLSSDHDNDEYLGRFELPSTAGHYDYAYRFSGDEGTTWLYCDLGNECAGASGSDDGYSASTAGDLNLLQASPPVAPPASSQ